MSDPYIPSVSTGLHFDGADGATTFTDIKGRVYTGNGGIALSTAQAKFGSASLLVGSGRWLSTDLDAGFNYTTGPFTLETWAYLTGNAAPDSSGSRNAVLLATDFWTTFYDWYITGDGSSTGFGMVLETRWAGTYHNASCAASIPHDQWVHLALDRQSNGVVTFYVDGTAYAGGTITAMIGGESHFTIGSMRSLGGFERYFPGHLDDVRVTNGVARYAGASFTPSTSAFPDFIVIESALTASASATVVAEGIGSNHLDSALSIAASASTSFVAIHVGQGTLVDTGSTSLAFASEAVASTLFESFARARVDPVAHQHKLIAFALQGQTTSAWRARFEAPASLSCSAASTVAFQAPRPPYEFECTLPARGSTVAIRARSKLRFKTPESAARAVHVRGTSRFRPKRPSGVCTVLQARASSHSALHARSFAHAQFTISTQGAAAWAS